MGVLSKQTLIPTLGCCFFTVVILWVLVIIPLQSDLEIQELDNESLEEYLVELKERVAVMENNNRMIEKQLNEERNNLERVKQELDDSESDFIQLQDEFYSLQVSCNEFYDENNQLENYLSDCESYRNVIETEIENCISDLEECNWTLSREQVNNAYLQEDFETCTNATLEQFNSQTETSSSLTSCLNDLDLKVNAIEELSEAVTKLEHDLHVTETERDLCFDRLYTLENTDNECVVQIDEKNENLSTLNKENEDEEDEGEEEVYENNEENEEEDYEDDEEGDNDVYKYEQVMYREDPIDDDDDYYGYNVKLEEESTYLDGFNDDEGMGFRD